MTSFEYDIDNATELRLGLPGTCPALRGSKRSLTDANRDSRSNSKSSETDSSNQEAAPVAKAQVVGWPPIRSYRRNNFQVRKTDDEVAVLYVKVGMDGAPYLRKIDLKMYKGYIELRETLEDMFKCFSLGDLVGMERRNGLDYAVIYEDKDGDWMLVGDVSWEMFISSCKRLRIMRVSEAGGLSSNS